MTGFAANIHFRSSSPDDTAGGYGWFLGRFAEWTAFEAEMRRQLHRLGFDYVECLTLVELKSEADLNEGEQKSFTENSTFTRYNGGHCTLTLATTPSDRSQDRK